MPLEEFIGRKFRRRARHHHHHHHHHQDQSDQPQPQPQPPQPQPQQQGERSTRVPLDFTWTIDDAAVQEPQKTGWCSGAWQRASRALRKDKSAVDAEPEPSPNLPNTTTMSMLKVVEREGASIAVPQSASPISWE